MRVERTNVALPFKTTKDAFEISDQEDVRAFVAALGLSQKAKSNMPRCMTAYKATLYDTGGAEISQLQLMCAGDTPVEPLIREPSPQWSWRVEDVDALRALFERLGS